MGELVPLSPTSQAKRGELAMFHAHPSATRTRAKRHFFPWFALAFLLAHLNGAAADTPEGSAQSPQSAAIQSIVDQAIKQNHLKGIIVQVRCGGKNLYLN